jgi:hypothetical protein
VARLTRLLLGAAFLAGACWSSVGGASREFTPYTPRALPQRAQGDFDGDGRADVALIQDGAHSSQVSVRLSGSSSVVYLNVNAGSLIAEDIDGDGDLDLVAGTPSGQVVAWINDGHGRFTLKKARPSSRIASETVFAKTLQGDAVAVGVATPLVVPDTRNLQAILAALARSPTVLLQYGLHTHSFSSPRAPPAAFFLS